MSLFRKGHIGLPARPHSSGAGGKHFVYRTLHPTLKDGVSAYNMTDTVIYLPRPLGRGLWINQRNGGFPACRTGRNPFPEWTQV
ncbi:MAG: hypothetical protein ISR82_08190 [Candidatus Marinimicrobia bacterium]|nr:hypothetical protein [Candidatus Neomarinimicrobiota bacterium]